MKSILFILFLFAFHSSFAQSTTIEARLYLPSHVKNTLTPNDKLQVYFTAFPGDTILKGRKMITAKKLRENVYEFQLPNTKLWHIGFSMGNYSYQMLCVNNIEGQAPENYSFNILLEPGKYNPDLQFLPPCIQSD